MRFVTSGSLVTLSWLLCLALGAGMPRVQQDDMQTQSHKTLIGLSAPSRKAQIACEHDGTIRELMVAESRRVIKGQILFRLNSRLHELRAKQLEAITKSDLSIEQGRSALEHAQRKTGRLRQLEADEVISTSDLEQSVFETQVADLKLRQAKFDRMQAASELEQLQEQIRQRTLRSPLAGVVTEIYKQTGEAAEKLTPVLEVASLDPLWVEFECPVERQNEFRLMSKIKVAPSTRPADIRTAEVIHVSLKANPSSHTFLVRAAVPNTKYSWRMGLKMIVHPPEEVSEVLEQEFDIAAPPPSPGK